MKRSRPRHLLAAALVAVCLAAFAFPPDPVPPAPEPPGRVIRGRVLAAETGEAIPGARVEERLGGRYSGVPTGPDGRFALRTESRRPRIRMTAEGRWPATGEIGPDRDRIDVFLDRVSRLTGRVLFSGDGSPAPGARVVVTRGVPGDDRAEEVEVTTADGRGAYRFDSLPGGELTVFVLGGGWATPDLLTRPPCLRLRPGETVTQDLAAVPTGVIAGRVLTDEGKPARACVVVRSGRRSLGDEVETDADGRFEIRDLPPDELHSLSVTADGFAVVRAGPVRLRPGEREEIGIRLSRPRYLDLLVLDESTGEPLAGAEADVAGPGVGFYGESLHVSGADGRIRIGPLPNVMSNLVIEHPECSGRVSRRVRPTDSGAFTVRLERGVSLRGIVVLPEGVDRFDLSASAENRTVKVGKDGRFQLDGLWNQEQEVYVRGRSPEGYWEATTKGMPGEEEVEIRLKRTDLHSKTTVAPVIVRVRDREGRPVPSATLGVRTTYSAGGTYSRPDACRFGVAIVTDAGADFRDITVEVYRVKTESGAPLPLAATVVGPLEGPVEEITITLGPERVIQGRITDQHGAGVPGIVVEASPESPIGIVYGAHAETRTAPDGSFRLGGLWEGFHEVSFDPPRGFGTTVEHVDARAGDSDVHFEVTRLPRGRVTVIDGKGRPFVGALVRMAILGLAGRDLRGTSDVNGEVVLPGLGPGDWGRLTVRYRKATGGWTEFVRKPVRDGDRVVGPERE